MIGRHWLNLSLVLWLSGVSCFAAQRSDDAGLPADVKTRAEKGDAEAQLTLGSIYANGTDVPQDPVKAAKWHRKAAEQGLARAQYQLGLDFAQGAGVRPDSSEAARWFRKAAAQGLAEAQLAFGLCCLNGEGVAENGREAVQWFHKASDQGQAAADYELGKCYLEGTGVARDTMEGVRWIQQAAERGFAAAQNRLGQCYEQGEGVTKDNIEAYKWFDLAAAQDDEHAADIRVSLAKVEARLTKDQIVQAQRLARDFKPSQAKLAGEAAATSGPAQPGQAGGTVSPADSNHAGVVNVTADNENCEIFLDGAFVGNPPAKLKLAEGAHVVEVKKAGCADFRRELKISAGSELTLRAVLEKKP
jgi:TPR repeat protein